MTRGVALSLAGFLVLVTLVGCGRSWFEAREPWRHDAEVECLKTGAVKQGPAIAQINPIQGPGVCGADFPLKVSALGASAALGFADEPRPPAPIRQYSPAPPHDAPAPPYPYGPPPAARAAEPEGPMSIHPPGVEPPMADPPGSSETIPLGPLPRALSAGSEGAAVVPAATLACPLVAALDNWIAAAVQPAAKRWFGQPVVEIKQISAYSCRSMNGQRGTPISEHAFGNALDVAAFTLADGRRVSVRDGWRGAPEERGFLHDVHAAACQRFATVLAPGSNAFHYDHIHVDQARRASGRAICNPRPIPGEFVAGRRDPAATGSAGNFRRSPSAPSAFAPTRDGNAPFDGYLPRAVPGED